MKRFPFILILSFLSLNIFAQNGTALVPTETEALAKFTITDKKGIPEEGAVVKVAAIDKSFKRQGTTDLDGKCAILITEGKPFNLTIDKFKVTSNLSMVKLNGFPSVIRIAHLPSKSVVPCLLKLLSIAATFTTAPSSGMPFLSVIVNLAKASVSVGTRAVPFCAKIFNDKNESIKMKGKRFIGMFSNFRSYIIKYTISNNN